ncbi:MAG: hypothetical protein EH225_04020 [Calditrichaeota bacterium]|nr:MAG: hypothetical protein EH225_04020 [Calditrichota bacterium]
MKIESISILNLNSLYGKNTIDFSQKPFNNSGLFAITGPTGAGKSTIFDAICLALYGRTPRLKNPDEIMSRHTGECSAELTFSVNGIKYRSMWEQRRSRGRSDGKLQSPRMLLIRISENEETVIEEKKSSVPIAIASITGLDYDQFSRSIMLAQGNFESFLKAGINERAELLEKMTGTELYSRLSIEAFNVAKDKEENLRRLKEKTGDSDILGSEDREGLEEKLRRLKENRNDKVEIREKLLSARNWQEHNVVIKHKLDNCSFELQEALEREKNIENLESELARKSLIEKNRPLYETWVYLEQEKYRLEKEVADLRRNKEQISLKQKASAERMDKAAEDKNCEELKAEKTAALIRSLELEENSLKGIIGQIHMASVEMKKESDTVAEQIELLSRNQNSLDRNEIVKKELDHYIKENAHLEKVGESLPLLKELFERFDSLAGSEIIRNFEKEKASVIKNLEQLDKKIYLIEREKPGNLQELLDIKEILKAMGPVSRRFREVLEDKKGYLSNKKSYTDELRHLRTGVELLEGDLRKYISLKQEADFSALVREVKSHLHEGDICPVCNGTISVLRNDDTVVPEEIKKNPEEELNQARTRISVLQERIGDIDKSLDKTEMILSGLLAEWNEIKENRFPGLMPDNKEEAVKIYNTNESLINDCRNWENEIEALKKDRENIIAKINNFEDADNIRKRILSTLSSLGLNRELTPDIMDELVELRAEFNDKASGLNHSEKEITRLKHDIELHKERISSINENIERLQTNLKLLEEKKSDLEKSIENMSEGKSVDQIESEMKKTLTHKKKIYDDASAEQNQLAQSYSSIRAALQRMEEALPRIHSEWKEKNKTFIQLQIELNIELSDFGNKGLAEEIRALEKEIKEVRDSRFRAEEALNHASESLTEHQKNKPDDELLNNISIRLTEIDHEINLISSEIGGCDEKIKRDDILRSKLDRLILEIEAHEKECRNWSRLRSLIGSADGKVFRRFVQGLTLDKLISLANIHLNKLNDRYRIERSDDRELEVDIIDRWQADTIRPASTLSGGESFLVSLALSLGLSELVGNKVVIDSLFLDEGFGTLDPDSLETVLSALETLQAGGKLIGIISHINAIRERISVQIRVRKLAGGKSQIEIV